MKRATWTVLSAGLLLLLGRTDANAGLITYTQTPFTASETTDFHAVSGFPSLPYTDSFNNIITPNGGSSGQIIPFVGLSLHQPAGTIPQVTSVTFALSAPTNRIGFSFLQNENPGEYLLSASFSNGDGFTGGPTFAVNKTFMGFSDTSSFTSVTLNFTGSSGLIMDDFRVAPTTAAPEPSSLALSTVVTAVACVVAWHRRKRLKATASA
jgi:hypothetical protein